MLLALLAALLGRGGGGQVEVEAARGAQVEAAPENKVARRALIVRRQHTTLSDGLARGQFR